MSELSHMVHLAMGAIGAILHFDARLDQFLQQYGGGTYAILCTIVFCETGLIVTPILPGDSLLFAVGAFAARGSLSWPLAFGLLSLSAMSGDLVNYTVGYHIGPKAVARGSRWIRREYVERTQPQNHRDGSLRPDCAHLHSVFGGGRTNAASHLSRF
jgi:membrane-associated protein